MAKKPTKKKLDPDQLNLTMRGGFWAPPIYKTTMWRPPDLATLPSWRGAKRVGVDTETKDPDLRELGSGVRRPGNYVVGISFAIDGGPKHYLPFRHEGGDNLPQANVLAYMKDQCKDFDGEIVGMNLPYDLDWLWELGVDMPKVKAYRDVGVADPLIYELHMQYSLEEIALRRGLPGKSEDALRKAALEWKIDPKKDLWRMPARHVGEYAEDDAERPLQVLKLQEADIATQNIGGCWEMESELLPILVRMTRKGVRVNVDRLDQIEEWSRRQEQAQWDLIRAETGVTVPLGHAMDATLLSQALRACGQAPDEISDNAGKVNKETLTGKHPVVKAILRARQVSTLRTTFAAGVRRHLILKNGDARIHCNFNQIRKTDDDTGQSKGVAYGRLSADHVNMQNQPGNSRFSGDNEVGPMWRSIYRAEEGDDYVAEDLKQQEPKWSFHYSAILEKAGVPGMKGAIALCERLQADPTLDTYQPLADAAGIPRPTSKITWLARAYGQGDGELCRNLGLPTVQVVWSRRVWGPVPVDSDEGRELASKPGAFVYEGAGPEGAAIINKFDAECPFLKTAAKTAKKRAEEYGYVRLLSGRRCHFERDSSGKVQWTHKAFNRIIQGTSAEQTKQIMIAVERAGFGSHLMLQVHDELDFSLPHTPAGIQMSEDIAQVMRTAVPMLVPTVVDIERGPSWGESMGVEFKDATGKKQKVTYKWGMLTSPEGPIYRDGIL